MRTFIGVALALFVLGLAPRAHAQGDPNIRAREAFNRGVELYEQGRYADALTQFRSAFDLRPHPSVRVNIANCLARLGQAVEGTYHFRRFLQERGDEVSPEQRAAVQREIDGMRMEVAELSVRVEPPDADVFVDGVHPDTRIGASIYISPGPHRIEARLQGRQTAREEVDLAGGARRDLVLVLPSGADVAPIPPPPARTAAPEPEPEPEPEPVPVAPEPEARPEPEGAGASASVDSGGFGPYLPWIGAGATVVALGVAIGFSASALTANDEVDLNVGFWETDTDPDHRAVYEHNAREWADAADTRALVADVFYVLTFALAAGTGYLFFFADDHEAGTSVAAAPWISPDGSGLVLAGNLTP